MATYFSILTWEIPWTEEPDRLHLVSQRVEHDFATKQQHKHIHTLISHIRYSQSSVLGMVHKTLWNVEIESSINKEKTKSKSIYIEHIFSEIIYLFSIPCL